MKQIEILQKCLEMIKETNPSPDTTLLDWVRTIMFAHTRGYLYTTKDTDSFVLAYRIPEWKEEYGKEMPAQEGGHKLYVSMAVSRSQSKLSLLKMLKDYMKLNNIDELIYHKRSNDKDLVRINLRRKNGKVESSRYSATATVPA